MKKSLDARLRAVEAGVQGRLRIIWVAGWSEAAIDAELDRCKAAGVEPLLISWKNPAWGGHHPAVNCGVTYAQPPLGSIDDRTLL
jgi:hypothetical protein